MNYYLISSRLSRLNGGFGLFSSHAVHNTAHARDACRLLKKELPEKYEGVFDPGRTFINSVGNTPQGDV